MTTLKEALAKKLSSKELNDVKTSFDTIGDIAIIELRRGMEKRAGIIGQTILRLNKHISTVLRKAGGHAGRFRTQKYLFVSGERRTCTIHRECGVSLAVDVAKAYYSPRLSTERLRIAKLIKKKETVLVIGSGIGPYPFVIVKNSPAKLVAGVEWNAAAHALAIENVVMNKLSSKIIFMKGDALKLVPSLSQFDRVIVAIPHTGKRFLAVAIKAVKKNGWLHYYDFSDEDKTENVKKTVIDACTKMKRKCIAPAITFCGQNAPRSYRVCVDVRIR